MSSPPDTPAKFDENVWYQISEGRVDVGGQPLAKNLVFFGPPDGLRVENNDKSWWQFLPVDDKENRYQMRTLKAGANFNLGVCFIKEEIHPAKTRLCMRPADKTADDQKWEVFEWEDGTTGKRIINVSNGTDWYLDVHAGNPPFINDDIDTSVLKPAQRWLVSSVSAVDEPGFILSSPTDGPESSNTPGSNPADPTPTSDAEHAVSDGSSGGVSAGAAAGIGIGCGAFLLLLGLGLFFFYWRKKQKNLKDMQATPPQDWQHQETKPYLSPSTAPIEAPTPEARYEAPPETLRHELYSDMGSQSENGYSSTAQTVNTANSAALSRNFSFTTTPADHIGPGLKNLPRNDHQK